MKKAKVGINIRPYLKETLDILSKNYIMIIYTASHQSYADAVVDYIDPEKKYFKQRLYRQNCLRVQMEEEFIYVKDLRLLENIDLKRTIIIDNSLLSFAFQLDNGIPILPYYDSKSDNEFISLINYLNFLYKADDIRTENRKIFKLEYLKHMSSPLKKLSESPVIKSDSEEIKLISLNPINLNKCFNNSEKIPTFTSAPDNSSETESSDSSFMSSSSNRDVSNLVNFEVIDKINHILDDLKKWS
jgi:Dullard-like phosphatase family protein